MGRTFWQTCPGGHRTAVWADMGGHKADTITSALGGQRADIGRTSKRPADRGKLETVEPAAEVDTEVDTEDTDVELHRAEVAIAGLRGPLRCQHKNLLLSRCPPSSSSPSSSSSSSSSEKKKAIAEARSFVNEY